MWQIRTGLDALKPYHVDDTEWRIKIDANERADNLPPVVRDEVLACLACLPFNRYPEMGMKDLKQLIAADLAVEINQVAIGCGSSELLAAVCHTFGGAGKAIVFPRPSFSMYAIYAKIADSRPVAVALDSEYCAVPEDIVKAAQQEQASLVLLCNPNNPTGTIMKPEDIEYVVSRVTCPVVVDEAYYEFYGSTSLALTAKYANVIIMRTFSKAYGLAAARVGYMIAAPEIIALVEKVLMPYHVNALSLTAAEVVYKMKHIFVPTIQETVFEREKLAAGLKKVSGITVYPSYTNFILFKAPAAGRLARELAAKGIGIRDFSAAAGLEDCIRVSIGCPEENSELLAAITAFYSSNV